ncbi:hypothetical protein EV641_106228 [Rhodococcus sp. SMB37]|uniref:hypothetical protein n=1 Tax=Rhodococcus sp. SMB37 TaxID=2512213 RepID=UPI001051D94F|nr:hypothetical protein [Rhodococcus sp. SMB37]TCN53582.1 hypothetical protein EV641_106228 [Rhodococcus sp. SMB37]
MGIRHFALDLPFTLSADGAINAAEAELRHRGVAGWTRLHLQSTSPTQQAGISTFRFAYWIPNRDPIIDRARSDTDTTNADPDR